MLPNNGFGQDGDAAETEAGTRLAIRLKQAIGSDTLDNVARRASIARRSLTRYVGGELPKLPALIAIADACAVSVEWLATGRGDIEAKFLTSRANTIETVDIAPVDDETVDVLPLVSGFDRRYVAIPRFNIQASAGSGALVENAQIVEYLAFDRDFVRTRLRRDPKNLVLIEAIGDSMEPTIRDGDILTVDISPNQVIAHSQLYVLRVEDNLLVKRIERRLDGALIIHSDNPRYGPETVARAGLETLNVLGQVILVSTPPR